MKLIGRSALLAGCFAASVWSAADTVKMETPAKDAVVTQFHPVQEMLVRLPLEDWRKLIAQKSIAGYWCKSVKSFPGGVYLDWSARRTEKAPTHYLLEWGCDPELKDAAKVRPPHSEYRLYNLLLGETYYYRVSLCKEDGTVTAATPISKFTVEMLPPRVMMVPGIDNIRDLGGYPAMDGRRLKQGMIYRSTGLNANSNDGGKTPGKARFTPEGKRILLEDLKIRTELDLRWLSETAGMKTSPLGESVTYVSNPSPLYAGAFTAEGKAVYAKSFRIFTERGNYPVNFHCIAGSDRTGTLAYLLEAVLGVPEEMLQKDYVFTSFYATRNFQYLAPIPKSLQACGKAGESALEQAERYWLSAGITPAEIQRFRDIMLGEGTKPDAILREAQRVLELRRQIATEFPDAVQSAAIVPYRNFRRNGVIAGRRLSCELPHPPAHSAAWKVAPDGRMVWHLVNADFRNLLLALDGKFPGDAKRAYYLHELFTDVWFAAPDGGSKWSAAELMDLKFLVSPGSERAFAAIPADAVKAPGKLAVFPAVCEADSGVKSVPVTELASAPDMDDPRWRNVPVQKCCGMFGEALEAPPQVQLAADSAHSELYLKVFVPDTTVAAKLRGRQADVWREDSVEIFLADSASSAAFQFVVGRSGGTFIAWHGAWAKRPLEMPLTDGVPPVVREVPGGWMTLVRIPLAGFGFTALPRFNLCGGDRPAEKLFNLLPTRQSFPDVASMGILEFR